MASHYLNLQHYFTPEEFSWSWAKGLPADTLKQAAGFQAPNGGMVYWVPVNARVSPFLSAYTALAFNWLRSPDTRFPKWLRAGCINIC